MTFEFLIPGEPVPQPRHRVGSRGAYIDDDNPIHAYKDMIGILATQAIPRSAMPIMGPLKLELICVFGRTKAEQKGKGLKLRMRHAKRPDIDNVIKAVMDALGSAGVFRDDGQIAIIETQKWTASGDEDPHTLVRLHQLGNA